MIHLSKILCPADYSATSDNAVRYAIEFARQVGAHVRILHIVTPQAPCVKVPEGDAPECLIPEEDDAIPENISTLLMAEIKKGLSADIRILRGEASKVISEQARLWGADLIIMGSHGRSGLQRLMMGSVAEDVFRSSDIPVLLVKKSAADKVVVE
ncbi:universal stress protein [Chlorobium sp. BLA1]|uniref:universal stress protein n=1 Tax=Candidatus Chlorobium masyuteum TaxID=2716876 RepID=UPI00141DC562|nr:universal stress protein [Candidatus Chlorobium masyuteum]NHQ61029.1 universal stress protein [Candidatus Chlorobium masyuteum]NTW98956.1 universal stress protein [Geobacteraceae bacterium]